MQNKNNNEINNVDIGCGQLIPKENLNPSQPGSVGGMLNALKNAYDSNNAFTASTSYGFKPGFTICGHKTDWGSATFQK